MTENCFVAAGVAFACALACALAGLRHAVRCDLRGVVDDLSGRRRQRGIDEELVAHAARSRSWKQAHEKDVEPVATRGSKDEAVATMVGTPLGETNSRTAVAPTFVVVRRLVLAQEAGKTSAGG